MGEGGAPEVLVALTGIHLPDEDQEPPRVPARDPGLAEELRVQGLRCQIGGRKRGRDTIRHNHGNGGRHGDAPSGGLAELSRGGKLAIRLTMSPSLIKHFLHLQAHFCGQGPDHGAHNIAPAHHFVNRTSRNWTFANRTSRNSRNHEPHFAKPTSRISRNHEPHSARRDNTPGGDSMFPRKHLRCRRAGGEQRASRPQRSGDRSNRARPSYGATVN